MSDSSSGDEYHPVINEPMAENPQPEYQDDSSSSDEYHPIKENPIKKKSEKVFSMMDPNNTSCVTFTNCFVKQFKKELTLIKASSQLFRADKHDFKVKLGSYSNTFRRQNFTENNLYRLNIDRIHDIIFYKDGDFIVVMQTHQEVGDDSKTKRTKQILRFPIDTFIDILNGFIVEDKSNESFKQSYLLLTGVVLPFVDIRYIVGMKHGSKKPEAIEGISLLRLETFTFNLGNKPKRRRTNKTKKRKTKKLKRKTKKKSTKKKKKRRKK